MMKDVDLRAVPTFSQTRAPLRPEASITYDPHSCSLRYLDEVRISCWAIEPSFGRECLSLPTHAQQHVNRATTFLQHCSMVSGISNVGYSSIVITEACQFINIFHLVQYVPVCQYPRGTY